MGSVKGRAASRSGKGKSRDVFLIIFIFISL
jgi:hypothetical protein